MAIKSFKNQGTKDIADSVVSPKARRVLPVELHRQARKRLAFMDAATSILDFQRAPRGYGWEILKGDRKGEQAIRINDQYRICFHFDGKDCEKIEIVDYH